MGIGGVDGSNSPRPVGSRVKAAGAAGADAAPGMSGDSLSLSKSQNSELIKEVKGMTAEEADKSVSTGGKMVVAGLIGTGAAYWGAGALVAATGVALLPAVIGVAAVGLALWGAMKVGKGLSAKMNQVMESKTKGLEGLGQ